MMTLHGLVMISELFAGFNLINTGVVNCLVMCKMHHTEAKKFWEGHSPSPIGEGTPPLQTPPSFSHYEGDLNFGMPFVSF